MRQLALTALVWAVLGSGSIFAQFDATLHVDNQDPTADDTNPGTVSSPLLTIQAAVDIAVDNKRNGISTRTLIHEGVYREFVRLDTYTNYPSNDPGNQTPMSFEGVTGQRIYISGADAVTTPWVPSMPGCFEQPWTYDWGIQIDPTGGARPIEDIVRRREMIFVDRQRMKQTMTQVDLMAESGTFLVDEANDVIYVCTAGIDPNGKEVEIAVRERLWLQEYEDAVTIKNINFVHASTPWIDAWSAVRMNGSDNVVLRDVGMNNNNGRALYVGDSSNLTWWNLDVSDNGWDGWGTWRVSNLTIRDAIANGNNWRGHLGGFYGWSVGNKLLAIHGLLIDGLVARNNFSRGLWLDYDIRDATLTNMEIVDNMSDGMFIEANPGPIVISDSEISNNGYGYPQVTGHGILAANSENVAIRSSRIMDNYDDAFRWTGSSGGRGVENFEDKQDTILFLTNWELTDNEIRGRSSSGLLMENDLNTSAWEDFLGSLTSDNNCWSHPDNPKSFESRNNQVGTVTYTLEEWQDNTGHDGASIFKQYSLPVELTSFVGLVDGRDADITWETASETDSYGFYLELAGPGGSFKDIAFYESNGTTEATTRYMHTESDLPPGTHRFRLRQVDLDGTTTFSNVLELGVGMEDALSIEPGGPGWVRVSSAAGGQHEISVYNALGQVVKRLGTIDLLPGATHEITLDEHDLSSGMYFVRAVGSNATRVLKYQRVR